MGFLDRLLGREEPRPVASGHPTAADARSAPASPQRNEDEIAVERYRYLLRTAPPETIEQVHEEAFTRLSPDQRRLLFQQLSESAPAGDQPRGDDPRSLAQAATRSELRQPGTLERSLAGGGGGGGGGRGVSGFGGMFASSLLGSVAGYVIGSALVSAFLPVPGSEQAGSESSADASSADANADSGGGDAASADTGWGAGDSTGGASGWDSASGDSGSGWGGDFGDFGGGDFI